MEKVWINGKITDSDNAKVSVFDRGFLYGDGVFETMRAYNGVVFKIDEHLKRLFRAIKATRIKSSFIKEYIKKNIYKMMELNDLENAYIRVAVTRGQGRFAIDENNVSEPTSVIVVKPFHPYPEDIFNKGISCYFTDMLANENSPLLSIKTMNYMNFIMARFEARDHGASEAILTNSKGFVTEAATSNIFMVRRGTLYTPSLKSGILPGITREEILKIAKKRRIVVKERFIKKEEFFRSDEVFLTNSLAEVLPVVKIDSKKISSGLPGTVTNLLRSLYQNLVLQIRK